MFPDVVERDFEVAEVHGGRSMGFGKVTDFHKFLCHPADIILVNVLALCNLLLRLAGYPRSKICRTVPQRKDR